MSKFLPFAFLIAIVSLFGLVWIFTEVDPESASWYIFAMVVGLIFTTIFSTLGLLLYFVRTRLYKRYSANWYVKTSFMMAFFVALFVAIVATLAIFGQINTFNVILAILAVSLFAFWSYLGKRN